MNSTFADWFGLVALRPNQEMLQKRKEAVETIAGWTKRPELLNLVRVAKNWKGNHEPLLDAAQATDDSFQIHQCEPELRVLAGAAIEEILKRSSKKANLVALATVTAGFGGTQGDALFKRVHELAIRFLGDEAVRARSFDGPIVGTKGTDFSENVKRFTTNAGAEPTKIAQHVATLVEEVAKVQGKMIVDLGNAVDALREESNMFWWAFAAYSRHFDRPYREIGLSAGCIVGALELAELTNLIPGPCSAAAILDRLLEQVDEKAKFVTVANAVNATDRQWRSRWVKAYAASELHELAPVLLAGAKSLETDSTGDWISMFTKSTAIVDDKLSPPAIALQTYQENLLVRALEMVKA